MSRSVIHIIMKITYLVNKIYKLNNYSDLGRASVFILSLPLTCVRLRLYSLRSKLHRNNL